MDNIFGLSLTPRGSVTHHGLIFEGKAIDPGDLWTVLSTIDESSRPLTAQQIAAESGVGLGLTNQILADLANSASVNATYTLNSRGKAKLAQLDQMGEDTKSLKDNLDTIIQMLAQAGDYTAKCKDNRSVLVSGKNGQPISVMQLMRDVSRQGFGSNDFNFARDGKGNAIVSLKALSDNEPDWRDLAMLFKSHGFEVSQSGPRAVLVNLSTRNAGVLEVQRALADEEFDPKDFSFSQRTNGVLVSLKSIDLKGWNSGVDDEDRKLLELLNQWLPTLVTITPDKLQQLAKYPNDLASRNRFSLHLQGMIRQGLIANRGGRLSLTPKGEQQLEGEIDFISDAVRMIAQEALREIKTSFNPADGRSIQQALNLRMAPAVFRNEGTAKSYAQRAGYKYTVVMGDDSYFWVCLVSDAQKLERLGYEWVI
jgi:hypothetical protein